MFIAIYQFSVIENKEDQFITAWKALTELIYRYEGSLGSRLHQQDNQTYIAYAQWPSKSTWKNAGGNLPEEAQEHRAKMKEACTEITTIHELECIEDLLQKEPYTK